MAAEERVCSHCQRVYARKRMRNGKLEDSVAWAARLFCSHRCRLEHSHFDKRLSRLLSTPVLELVGERAMKASEIASVFGVGVMGTPRVAAHLERLRAAGEIEAAGKRGHNERVYVTVQRRLPLVGRFEKGRGNRRETCTEYDACLDRWDEENPNSNSSAKCPTNCSFFVETPRAKYIEDATYGTGMSSGYACQFYGANNCADTPADVEA